MSGYGNLLEACIVTNGRSTFEFARQALAQQENISVPIREIHNLDHVLAYETMLSECESTFVLRIDDDMFLHPWALQYIYQSLEHVDPDECACVFWMLYEPWARGIILSLKAYSAGAAKCIGFRADHRGKVDRNFRQDAEKVYDFIKKESVLALHACPDPKENLRYMILRGEDQNPDHFKTRLAFLNRYPVAETVSVEAQFEASQKMIEEVNAEQNTPFHAFILSGTQP